MFAKRITTLFVFTALLFAPSILAKPMPAAPSGLAARASYKHAQAVGHSTKLMSTYKGHHASAAKRAAKAKSVAHLHRRQDADADADDVEVPVADTTTGDDTATVEDADTTAGADAVDGEEAAPTRRQNTVGDDTAEPASEDTSDGSTEVDDSATTAEDAVADVEDASDDAGTTEDSVTEGDVVDASEATLEGRQDTNANVNTSASNNAVEDGAQGNVSNDVKNAEGLTNSIKAGPVKKTQDSTSKLVAQGASTSGNVQGDITNVVKDSTAAVVDSVATVGSFDALAIDQPIQALEAFI